MIFFHLTRIVASADSASVSIPLVGGINVGNQGTGGQLLTQQQLAMLQNCPGGTVQPSQALENKYQPPMLPGPDGGLPPESFDGGGKKRRKRKTRKRRKTKRRKRKTKRKTKKRKRHRRKKKKSTRKR